MQFLIYKCIQPNPNLRLNPYMIILYMAQMQITKISSLLEPRSLKMRRNMWESIKLLILYIFYLLENLIYEIKLFSILIIR